MLSLAQAACRRCSRALSHRTLPRIPDGQDLSGGRMRHCSDTFLLPPPSFSFSADFIGTQLLFEPRTILLLRFYHSAFFLRDPQLSRHGILARIRRHCLLLPAFGIGSCAWAPSYLAWLFCLSTSLPLPLSLHSVLPPANSFRVFSDGLPVRLAQQVPLETLPDFCFSKKKTLWYDTFPRACRFESSAYAEPYSSE